ncbi:transcription initiation factor TFIID subunit 2-like [Diadema setosum]|uniref:transcription initiation factor TFIID subunit 2-like n=1 Tax=Diadema setosum TaxID=31175 RepID=UPI003B3A229D
MSKSTKKPDKSFETPRPFRLSHQILCITAINFSKKSMVGYTELHLLPLRSNVNRIKLNCKQCRVYRILINDQWDAQFVYSDPTLAICQHEMKQRNLVFFSNRHQESVASVDGDQGCGELVIKIPKAAMHLVNEQKTMRLSIEFSLEKPAGGIHFVVSDPEEFANMPETAAHMFTYNHENSSRLWFPCIDSFSEPCTWKLEFTVDAQMVAVSSGELIETVYTPDMSKKTYHYILNIPTSASNIALAVGPFEIVVDPTMHEFTYFCLPKLKPLLEHTTAFFHEVVEFYEETLGTCFPYTCYKQVFVDEAYDDSTIYASMAVFSTNLLHSAQIIDQTFETRRLLSEALAAQFFGCYICPEYWDDTWLTKGISRYLTGLCLKKMFGTNEYRAQIYEELTKLCKYEQETGGIVLHPTPMEEHSTSTDHTRTPGGTTTGSGGDKTATPSASTTAQSTAKPRSWGANLHFPCANPHTVSWRHWKMIMLKSHLIMRLIEIRVGQELLLKVFNKLLSLATQASHQKFMSNAWSNMLVSTTGFLKSISTVSGKDLRLFIDRWVCQGGMAQFHGNFHFNRKRNIVELELRQDPGRPGIMKYVGPLKVTIQELDGSFEHTLQVEDNMTKGEITCHSKSRRHKKKKIPLKNGEEVDMDLSKMDPDSPVLWIRVDTEMTLLREVIFDQPDYQFQCQLRYERDVVAQLEALECLRKFPSLDTTNALSDIILNPCCFYKVRINASFCYAQVSNEMAESFSGHTALIAMFRKLYSSYSCEDIVKRNKFSDFRAYFMQKVIPQAVGLIRNNHSLCPRESLCFLVDLIKYNDNAKNKFSDCYYRASLIDALSNTITPAVAMVNTSVENLSPETKMVLEEVTRCLNLEKLLPCYQHTVTISCLRAIRLLQKNSHLPSEPTLFQAYAQYGHFIKVRLAALEALVDYVKVEASADIFSWLLDTVEQDPVPVIKHKLLRMLIDNPPFRYRDDSKLSTDELVERLWAYMNSGTSHDSRLRCDVVDFFFTLYGKTRPACLPLPELGFVVNLKERTTAVNPSIIPDEPTERDGGETGVFQGDAYVDADSDSDQENTPRNHSSSSPGVASPRVAKREMSSPIDVEMEVETVLPVKRERLDSEERDPLMSSLGQTEVKMEVRERSPSSPLEPGELDDSSRDSFTAVAKATPQPSSPSSSSIHSLHRDDSRSSLASDPGKGAAGHHYHHKKKKSKHHKHRHKHRHDRPDRQDQSSPIPHMFD